MNLDYTNLDGLRDWAAGVMGGRAPDYVIGDPPNPYLRRWWIVPRNEGCNVYLHEILRSDDDRAGHDHPWANRSYLIDGGYQEVIYYRQTPWVEMGRFERKAGDYLFREAEDTHRLIVPEGGRCISLFMTGPKVRDWGFWCPGDPGSAVRQEPRFVPWQEFTGGEHGELVGQGCGV